MTTYQNNDERSSNPGYAPYPRPPTSSHGGDLPSPERLHSSQGYVKGGKPLPQSPYHGNDQGPPGSSHGYPPQPPITPLSGSSYPPQPPPSGTPYYGLSTPSTDQQHAPSPPPSSSGRPESANFTSEGAPIVPVGISGGKMFRCRGYGDCDKVFTRSEHLARHVRKHTGERPFPCHCGKAFSRLDNLRQHSATVHADQAALNEAMLTSLAPVHAALSQRANRDQRKRGEVVEVPKNAVERPRHNEQYRKTSQPPVGAPDSPYTNYPPQDHQFTVPLPPSHVRPRTGGGYDYPYPEAPPPPADESGPSRRPGSSYSSYQPVYYDQAGTRPATASSTAPEMSSLPYPYRPMSANGRDLPVPAHYQESEPPGSAHGLPPSPMYAPPPPHGSHWSSPPAPPSSYPPHAQPYPPPPPENYSYPPPPDAGHYPPPPGSSHGAYYPLPPSSASAPGPYYPGPPQQGYNSIPPPSPSYPPPHPAYGPPAQAGGPPESAFHYNTPHTGGPSADPYGYYDSRKRRADEVDDGSRKASRPSIEHQNPPPVSESRGQEPLWLPPTTERRSSLAISALLGSPQQVPRSRPVTADHAPPPQAYSGTPSGYTYTTHEGGNHAAPPTPQHDATESKGRNMKLEPGMGRVGENMEQKAKALLSQGR